MFNEIAFNNDFKLNEERKYIIWNYANKRKEEYILKKVSSNFYALYLEDNKGENPLFHFYGMWEDLTDNQLSIMENAIKEVHGKISKRNFLE